MTDRDAAATSCPFSHLTTAFGAPVVDNENSMTAGPRGPLLMQDVWLLEKLANLDREIILERRMHAKGSGAFGTLTVTNDITRYTRAGIFGAVGKARGFASSSLSALISAPTLGLLSCWPATDAVSVGATMPATWPAGMLGRSCKHHEGALPCAHTEPDGG